MDDNKREILQELQCDSSQCTELKGVCSNQDLKNSNCKSDLIDKNKGTSDPLDNLYELSRTLSLQDFENEIIKYPEGEIFTQVSNDLRCRSTNTIHKDFSETTSFLNKSENELLKRKNQDERNSSKRKTSLKCKVSSNTKDKQLASKSTYQIIAFTLIAVSIIAVCLVAICGYNIYLSDEKIRKFEKKICPFNKLINKYPLEEESLWMTLKYEIEDVINFKNSEKPSIYLFLQNQNLVSNHIMKDIVDLSASCFEKKLKPIILTGNDFNSNQNLINQISNTNEANESVILLIDLNGISDTAAETLDIIFENGLVSKKFIIFLSLGINSGLEGQSVQPIENIVREFFKPFLTKNKIDMLLRLLSKKVFRLKS